MGSLRCQSARAYSQPRPFGAFKPSEFLIWRFTENLAARLFFKEGFLIPNFMVFLFYGIYSSGNSSMRNWSQGQPLTWRYDSKSPVRSFNNFFIASNGVLFAS